MVRTSRYISGSFRIARTAREPSYRSMAFSSSSVSSRNKSDSIVPPSSSSSIASSEKDFPLRYSSMMRLRSVLNRNGRNSRTSSPRCTYRKTFKKHSCVSSSARSRSGRRKDACRNSSSAWRSNASRNDCSISFMVRRVYARLLTGDVGQEKCKKLFAFPRRGARKGVCPLPSHTTTKDPTWEDFCRREGRWLFDFYNTSTLNCNFCIRGDICRKLLFHD